MKDAGRPHGERGLSHGDPGHGYRLLFRGRPGRGYPRAVALCPADSELGRKRLPRGSRRRRPHACSGHHRDGLGGEG